ncbi:rRNA N6-adenosine-methyltransferase METTL5-like [Clytia hemisphaerica]|uniref:Methyltransferase-like protein 5 n=1 Tax=Clytia hemisphaerica TaxID=252671 RepID=A0A7M5XE65_9CNID|eukprot:TCONS_00056328-protein
MKLKELQSYLQQVEGFDDPKVHLEQYVTSGHIASHMLYTMSQTFDDIANNIVADFGCGCGVLSIGSAMLDAGQVFSFDVDSDALEICQSNVDDFDVTSTVELISCDLMQSSTMLDYLTERRYIDTVVMNPPFGTKNNKGIDMYFLQKAISIANNAVYSLHKTSTRSHVIKKAEEMNCTVEVLAELRYDLPKTYKFHKKQSLDVQVDFIRCQPNR